MYTPKFTKPRVLSVSQLNFYIKSLIENDPKLQTVFVEGEISNLSDRYSSGHLYFSLKDQKALISAVMFAGNARRLVFAPKNGMKIICRGRVSLYEPSGRYQIIIEDMQPQGVGALALAFEQLKQRLAEKGLFDARFKKPIPKLPKRIGVITSPSGAAVQDIKNILTRRFPNITIILCPVLVQGDSAPPQMIDAIQKLNRFSLCDVIIIGRGGGSMEDLWAFNSEELAYAVFKSEIPVISAVGHETDYTICDFVSDLRAPTPSAAAELAVPDSAQIKRYLINVNRRLKTAGKAMTDREKNLLLSKSGRVKYDVNTALSATYESRLRAESAKLKAASVNLLNNCDKKLLQLKSKLEASDPQKLLSRGLAVVKKDGEAVTSSLVLKKDDRIVIHFADGSVSATVTGD
ncbi:MAG: exodeoxyribonuclease VII large subunit [Ruminococcus sp.]|nr:exodeoxyribonuclease VII large subunit [Ruminococcus sp.]